MLRKLTRIHANATAFAIEGACIAGERRRRQAVSSAGRCERRGDDCLASFAADLKWK